ncbi:hypothetical protein BV25DRAFT_1922597 [Artomyces pyxidatus]|uniref:Uncharacterized protein n=1 Tax=Artomyces pyxidatus TaxID=48021 RepID=A0ACB8SED3_9AGAM|nr:hypothetical protein BV25DRAFT_1922597 [Artomyces pyxidatus]
MRRVGVTSSRPRCLASTRAKHRPPTYNLLLRRRSVSLPLYASPYHHAHLRSPTRYPHHGLFSSWTIRFFGLDGLKYRSWSTWAVGVTAVTVFQIKSILML